jgi:hypothetical protein
MLPRTSGRLGFDSRRRGGLAVSRSPGEDTVAQCRHITFRARKSNRPSPRTKTRRLRGQVFARGALGPAEGRSSIYTPVLGPC